uniref:Peptidase M12B domain-containing protein n=1 Tax=Strigamia maritima TaxID=126957 RepID=T1J9R7_STRMM
MNFIYIYSMFVCIFFNYSSVASRKTKINEYITLSRHERSFLFGSGRKVPKYQLVYLPVFDGRQSKTLKRQVETNCQPFNLNITAFGQELELELTPNQHITNDNLLLVTRTNEKTLNKSNIISDSLNGCHYHGEVITLPGGKVALSLHRGYTGIIVPTVGEHWLVHPAPRRIRNRHLVDAKVPHIIYKKENSEISECGHTYSNLTREKRSFHTSYSSSNQLSIETAVFVDKDMYNLMKTSFPADPEHGVMEVVLAMINAAELLFQAESLETNIKLTLVQLEIQKTEFEGLKRSANIDEYLKNFCSWQKKINPNNDDDPLHWDHALLLTGSNLYSQDKEGKQNNQVVGLAPVSGMCLFGNSCSVNEGGHFEAVYVIAHELGHSMGMQHDGPQNSNKCDKNKFIMSPTLGSGKTTWSACSREYLLRFLRSAQARCLWDQGFSPQHLNHQRNTLLPGQRFHPDQQCRLKFGSASMKDPTQPLDKICQDLQCLTNNYPLTSHPALEGSFCGENKYCRSGNCVLRPLEISLRPINGGWGQWSPFGPCASSCLSSNDGQLSSEGIMLSTRRCDNPHPEHSGKPCKGKHHRYKLCHLSHLCPKLNQLSISDYATHICSAAAASNEQLTGSGEQLEHPDVNKACSVWCLTKTGETISRNWKFPDGTQCKMGNVTDVVKMYCVEGMCEVFEENELSE